MLYCTAYPIQESDLQGNPFVESMICYLNQKEVRSSYVGGPIVEYFDYDFKILRCAFIIRCNGI